MITIKPSVTVTVDNTYDVTALLAAESNDQATYDLLYAITSNSGAGWSFAESSGYYTDANGNYTYTLQITATGGAGSVTVRQEQAGTSYGTLTGTYSNFLLVLASGGLIPAGTSANTPATITPVPTPPMTYTSTAGVDGSTMVPGEVAPVVVQVNARFTSGGVDKHDDKAVRVFASINQISDLSRYYYAVCKVSLASSSPVDGVVTVPMSAMGATAFIFDGITASVISTALDDAVV